MTSKEGNMVINETCKDGIMGSDLVRRVPWNNVPCVLVLQMIHHSTAFPN